MSDKKSIRRKPWATSLVILLGLILSGGGYAAATTTVQNESGAEMIEEGRKLFLANCATCHGMNSEGTEAGPSLIGVGAASVDVCGVLWQL